MIFHMSFGAADPAHAAGVLAELTGATPILAPSPPFPHGSWLICYGDRNGTLVELLPRSCVFDPDAPLGLKRTEAAPGGGSAHVLVGTPLPFEAIRRIAEREGWPIQEVETGLFKVVKVWVEGAFLVEFLTPEEACRYAEAFGTEGLPELDGKLRQLEASMAAALAKKIPPQLLAAVLGQPQG